MQELLKREQELEEEIQLLWEDYRGERNKAGVSLEATMASLPIIETIERREKDLRHIKEVLGKNVSYGTAVVAVSETGENPEIFRVIIKDHPGKCEGGQLIISRNCPMAKAISMAPENGVVEYKVARRTNFLRVIKKNF